MKPCKCDANQRKLRPITLSCSLQIITYVNVNLYAYFSTIQHVIAKFKNGAKTYRKVDLQSTKDEVQK